MVLYKMVAHFTMRTYGVNRNLDMLKTLGYTKIVIESDFFLENAFIYIIRAQDVLRNHLI